ncbi:hypothetical protein [Brumimicrobium aurantiacum]|uniref:Uncharacterized protein n=1 Tax=Brumimicrobium aurantiacum TaxID=1737063 RepID=A0A3E1F156_9FLAO|nr:hypothetical protein [Brumimicrobium aurantiacum]RFC55561.1 hypothetical protein DXU93_01115 [Brumimicrobium aurantiacum]
MKNSQLLIIIILLFGVSQNSIGQDAYFYNQKNIFSIRANFNPRLIPLSQNQGSPYGVGRGTYYLRYNENNELLGGHQKMNLMLNANYARLYNGNKVIGFEVNYQKHHFTMSENAIDFIHSDSDGYYNDIEIPYHISTPIFNTFDFQVQFGSFSSSYIAPNKHLWTYGFGIRLFSLDQNQNYRKDSETPYTDLDTYMEDYDKPFIFYRFSVNYTYRTLITKNLSFDIGFNLNAGLAAMKAEAVEGDPSTYGSIYGDEYAYNRYFIQAKLAHETFYNIIYFRTGLSFAI